MTPSALALVNVPPGGAAPGGVIWDKLGSRPIIDWITAGLQRTQAFDHIYIWPSDSAGLNHLEDHVDSNADVDILYSAHSTGLDPLVRLISQSGRDAIARVQAPCPVIDTPLVARAMHRFYERHLDYLCATGTDCGFPLGVGLEILSAAALKAVASERLTRGDDRVITFRPKGPSDLLTEHLTAEGDEHQPNLDISWSSAAARKRLRTVATGLSPSSPLSLEDFKR